MPDANLPDAYLYDFRVQRPAFAADAATSVDWLSAAHAEAEARARNSPAFDREGFRERMRKAVARFGPSPAALAARGHDCEDFLHQDWDRMRVFDLRRRPGGAPMGERMALFAEIAARRFDAFYPGGEEAPEELVHVTCTGYAAPSAPQRALGRLGWSRSTRVTHAYHMGCYAAMPAIRMAAGFLAGRGPRARADIVHCEACTLHLDPLRHDPEQLVVQSLFADGHIRYSLRPAPPGAPAFRVLATHEETVPESLAAMGWYLGDGGMRMALAREVPEIIAGALPGFLAGLYARAGLDPEEARAAARFAIHPGGPRIIDAIAALLGLEPAQSEHSRAVLRECGNMSSATLPHVWARMLADPALPPGTAVVSMAFGPGLTVSGCVLRKT